MGSMYCDVCGDHLGYHCQGAPCPKPVTPEPLGVWPVKTLTIEDARERWPATPQPPEWLCSRRGESAILWHWWIERGHKGGPTCETCGTTIQAFRDEDRLCATPLDRALEDFTARRKAKREAATMPVTFEEAGHVWGFNTDACVNCGYTAQALVATQYLPLCADQRGINAQAKVFARAMSTPLPHDPPMSARLMPWRGKE